MPVRECFPHYFPRFLASQAHAARAAQTKHMLWSDLKPVIQAHPQTIFILIHFSHQYKEDAIREHFRFAAL